MSHTLTTYFFLCNFNTTSITNDSFITDSFVFTTVTFIIFNRTENSLTKQTISFWFVCSVINRFRLKYFTTEIAQELFSGEANEIVILLKLLCFLCFFSVSHNILISLNMLVQLQLIKLV